MYDLLIYEFTNYINFKIYNLVSKEKVLKTKQIMKYIGVFYFLYSLIIFGICTFMFEIMRVSNISLNNYNQLINVIMLLGVAILPFTKSTKIAEQLSKNEIYNKILFNTKISLRKYLFTRILVESILFLTLFGLFSIVMLFSMQLSFGKGLDLLISYLISYSIYCVTFLELRLTFVCIKIIIRKYKGIVTFFIVSVAVLAMNASRSNSKDVFYYVSDKFSHFTSNLFNVIVFQLGAIFLILILLKATERKLRYLSSEDLTRVHSKKNSKINMNERNSETKMLNLIAWKELTNLKRHKEAKGILLRLIIPLIVINICAYLFNIKLNVNIVSIGFTITYTTIFVAVFRKYAFISSEKYCIKYIIFSSLNINRFIYYKLFIYMVVLLTCILFPINLVLLSMTKLNLNYLYCNVFAISYVSTVVVIEYFSDACFPNFNQIQGSENKVNSKGNLIAQVILSIYLWLTISVNSIMGVLNYREALTESGFLFSTSLINIIIAAIFILSMIFYYNRKGQKYWRL